MDLYLIRHADAVAVGEQGITEDTERPLSAAGEAQVSALAAGLNHRGVNLTAMVTSPLRRARETAEGILQQWPPPAPELVIADELAPGAKRRKLARFLRDRGGDKVAVVGHEPDLSRFAAWLIGSKKAQIQLAKAGLASLACPDGPRKGAATLVWLITPEWLHG